MKKVYVLENESGNVKIGVSSNTKIRFKTIENSTGIKILRTYETDLISNSFEIEKELKKCFKKYNLKGEWYNCDYEVVLKKLISKENEFVFKQIEENKTNNFIVAFEKFKCRYIQRLEDGKKERLHKLTNVSFKEFSNHFEYQKEIGGEELIEFEKEYPNICNGIFNEKELEKYRKDLYFILELYY